MAGDTELRLMRSGTVTAAVLSSLKMHSLIGKKSERH